MEIDRVRKPVDFIDLPKDSRGFIDWTTLRQDPVDLIAQVEREARKLLALPELEGRFTNQALIELGLSGFLEGVRTNYPGGVKGLKETLGIQKASKTNEELDNFPDGLPRDKRGRIRWSILAKDQDRYKNIILEHSHALRNNGRVFSSGQLRIAGFNALAGSINRHIPGGYREVSRWLEEEMATLPVEEQDLPQDSSGRIKWKVLQERGQVIQGIQNEVKLFYEEHGGISGALLTEKGRSGLASAIHQYYPGRWKQLRIDIEAFRDIRQGLRVSNDDKRVMALEQYGLSLKEKGVVISHRTLVEAGEDWYRRAVGRYYPGGIRALREKLVVSEGKATRGKDYWVDISRIENEAKTILEEYGDLSASIIRQSGNEALVGAIFRRYPGKLAALKTVLGVDFRHGEQAIRAEDANEELTKLLEDV